MEHPAIGAEDRDPAVLIGGDLLGGAAGGKGDLGPGAEGAVDGAGYADLAAGGQAEGGGQEQEVLHVRFILGGGGLRGGA